MTTNATEQSHMSGKTALRYLFGFCVLSIVMIGGTVFGLYKLDLIHKAKVVETIVDPNIARMQMITAEYRRALDHTEITQKDFMAIYQANEISGVPWQTIAALFFDESTNGTNIGRYSAHQVISGAQLQAYKNICRHVGVTYNWAKVARGGEMGPFQFMPLTWQEFGVDADGDGIKNPYSVADSAATAGKYLVFRGYNEIPWNAVRSYKGGTKGEKNAEHYTGRVMRLASDMGAPLDL